MPKETVIKVSDALETRLWKTLDTISDRLVIIEKQLSEVVRLQERVNHHEDTLSRFGALFDQHGERIRKIEMWQAHHGESNYDDHMIDIMRSNIKNNSKRIIALETDDNRDKGQKDITKEVLKWFSAIITGILVYKITRG